MPTLAYSPPAYCARRHQGKLEPPQTLQLIPVDTGSIMSKRCCATM